MRPQVGLVRAAAAVQRPERFQPGLTVARLRHHFAQPRVDACIATMREYLARLAHVPVIWMREQFDECRTVQPDH